MKTYTRKDEVRITKHVASRLAERFGFNLDRPRKHRDEEIRSAWNSGFQLGRSSPRSQMRQCKLTDGTDVVLIAKPIEQGVLIVTANTVDSEISIQIAKYKRQSLTRPRVQE